MEIFKTILVINDSILLILKIQYLVSWKVPVSMNEWLSRPTECDGGMSGESVTLIVICLPAGRTALCKLRMQNYISQKIETKQTRTHGLSPLSGRILQFNGQHIKSLSQSHANITLSTELSRYYITVINPVSPLLELEFRVLFRTCLGIHPSSDDLHWRMDISEDVC